MAYGLIGVEVGVLLSPKDEEFDSYNINNPKLHFGFYDENQYVVGEDTLEQSRKDVLSYVKEGVEGTYGILSVQSPASDEEEYTSFVEGESEYQFDYAFFRDKEEVLYSVCKKDGEIIEGFLEAALDELEKTTIVENGNKYVMTSVGFCSDKLADFKDADSFVGDIECSICLNAAPNEEFERIAREKDGEHYNPECFFLSATVGRDSVQDDWTTSNWFLFYVDYDGKNILLDDTAELMPAWEYFKKEANPFKEYQSVKDLIVNAAEKSLNGSDKTVSEPEHCLD